MEYTNFQQHKVSASNLQVSDSLQVVVKPYLAPDHEKFLCLLLASRDMPTPTFIPKMGAIAFVDDQVVAAGFIREAEGHMGIWDGLITRSNAPKHIRHVALNDLVNYLVEEAKRAGLERLICWTNDEGILDRAFVTGFKLSECHLMAMDLKGE